MSDFELDQRLPLVPLDRFIDVCVTDGEFTTAYLQRVGYTEVLVGAWRPTEKGRRQRMVCYSLPLPDLSAVVSNLLTPSPAIKELQTYRVKAGSLVLKSTLHFEKRGDLDVRLTLRVSRDSSSLLAVVAGHCAYRGLFFSDTIETLLTDLLRHRAQRFLEACSAHLPDHVAPTTSVHPASPRAPPSPLLPSPAVPSLSSLPHLSDSADSSSSPAEYFDASDDLSPLMGDGSLSYVLALQAELSQLRSLLRSAQARLAGLERQAVPDEARGALIAQVERMEAWQREEEEEMRRREEQWRVRMSEVEQRVAAMQRSRFALPALSWVTGGTVMAFLVVWPLVSQRAGEGAAGWLKRGMGMVEEYARKAATPLFDRLLPKLK